MSEKRYHHTIQPGMRKARIDVFCSCGGTVMPFSTDLVACQKCTREYMIVRRGNKARLLPVRPEPVDDQWETEVERLLRDA